MMDEAGEAPAGAITRAGATISAAFVLDDAPVQLKRLAREDLLFAPISGLPTLRPRGERLLAIRRGERPSPLD